ncbi:MAG: phosphatidylserine/phosphatidylglycerophosphate/cardiolipin synthase family protein [Candidatus Dormibacteraeota bacterium]|uniref:phospholipase D n=1 Tax=Candidatus Amunia macphersoniae TaxID=3127014 RepID=A0A934KQ60_9BACT|nr:phosphatidylserine/phosphatidylglycerophosphate/cardiolipin synthase family protein [Candidatus Dormibacteraeota bacterium]
MFRGVTRALAGLAAVLAAGCGTVVGPPARDGLSTGLPLLAPAEAARVGADTITVLRSGAPTFTELTRLVTTATRSVEIEVYEFGRRDLVVAVIAAHARGLAVTVIGDRSEMATAATAQTLRAQGIDVVDYPIRARMIDHVKLLVVDRAVAVVGGINWGTGSAANHDFDVEVRGPAVANLDRVFARDLVTCGRAQAVPSALADSAVLVASTLPGAEILPMVLAVVAGARSTLDVAMFTLTDAAVVNAMEAALARGVAVRVLLDPSERPSDPSAASLRAHGVAVRLYRSSGEKLHAKAAIADAADVVLGSANWTISGFEHNHELDVTIPSAPPIARAFEQQFESDWAASA